MYNINVEKEPDRFGTHNELQNTDSSKQRGIVENQSFDKEVVVSPKKNKKELSFAFKAGSVATIGSMLLSACTTVDAKSATPPASETKPKSTLVLTETPTLTPEPTYTPTKTATPTEIPIPTEVPISFEIPVDENGVIDVERITNIVPADKEERETYFKRVKEHLIESYGEKEIAFNYFGSDFLDHPGNGIGMFFEYTKRGSLDFHQDFVALDKNGGVIMSFLYKDKANGFVGMFNVAVYEDEMKKLLDWNGMEYTRDKMLTYNYSKPDSMLIYVFTALSQEYIDFGRVGNFPKIEASMEKNSVENNAKEFGRLLMFHDENLLNYDSVIFPLRSITPQYYNR